MHLPPESSPPSMGRHAASDGGSLTQTVLLSGVALFLVLVAVLWLNLREERRQLIEKAYAMSDRQSLRLAVHAGEVIGRADKALMVLKSIRENGNPVTLENLSRGNVTSEDVASAFLLTDRKGVVTDTTSADVVLNLGDDDYFKHMARNAGTDLVIGLPAADHIRGGWVIPLMRRIEGPRGFDGVVVALLRPDALVHGNLEERSDETARSVIGLDGFVRARRINAKVTVEGKIPTPGTTVERLRKLRASGTIDSSPIDGRRFTPVATLIEGYPLIAVAANAASEIEAGYVEARDRNLAWGAVASLVLLIGCATLWQQARQLEGSRRVARRANALYEATLEGSLDALWLMDPVRDAEGNIVDFTISEANRRSLDMVRRKHHQVVGQRLSDLLPTSKEDGLFRMLARVHGTRQAFDGEAPGTAEALRGRWVHLQAVPAGESLALIVRDITERRDAAVQLAEREAFLRILLDALPVAVYAKNAKPSHQGQILFWNLAAEKQYGLTAEQVIGRTTHAYLNHSADEAVLQDTEVVRQRRVMAFPELVFESATGTRYLDFLKAPVFDAEGEISMVLVIAEDVTEQRHAAEQLRLMSRVVHEAGDAIVVTDIGGRLVLANEAFAAMCGRPIEGLIGADAQAVGLPRPRDIELPGVETALRSERRWAGEYRMPRLGGESVETWMHVCAMRNAQGRVTHLAGIFSDISVLKTQERELAQLARSDALTQLANRRHFEEELVAATARARRHGQPLALVYLDLDGFKRVNDTLGHEAGDQLLIEVGRRLTASVRAIDLVSRLGGDEFTVILEYAGSEEDQAQQCQRMLDELSRPHELGGRQVVSTPSIGVAVYDMNESIESLRQRADAAMYRAKRAGKGRVCTADSEDKIVTA